MQEDIKKYYRMSQIFNMRTLSDADFSFINSVKNLIPNLGEKVIITTPTSTTKALNKGIDNLKILGNQTIIDRTKSILLSIPIYSEPIIQEFSTKVVFDLDREMRLSPKGKVKNLTTPLEYGETSHTDFSYEYLHMLKETNLKEYKDFLRYSEVIPLLFTLIINSKENDINQKRTQISNRLILLRQKLKQYNKIYNTEFYNPNLKEELKGFKSELSKDLLDLYYAFILFEIYECNPTSLINNVNKVLNHEMTTQELLNKYGLLNKHDYTSFKENISKLSR